MMCQRFAQFGFGLVASLTCLPALLAQPYLPEAPIRTASADGAPFHTRTASSQSALQIVPIDSLPVSIREKVRKVMVQPTLVTHAPKEEFAAAPQVYEWLLDHPDRATMAWQRLGVQCTPIQDKGQGKFSWSDGEGSEVVWSTIYQTADVRVWYSEGKVKPGALLPTIPVRAVVVLRHNYPANTTNITRIRHQVDVFATADSRAANLVARLLGPTADHLAEQGAEQMLTFFGVLAEHLGRHPEQTEKLLSPRR